MRSFVLSILISLTLLGCNEDILPRAGLSAPYSLYGVLSPDLDVQSVRVYPLESIITRGSPESLDLVVRSTDLQTGYQRTWDDSVVVASDSSYAHIYFASFQAEKGHRYRIDAVRRRDGATTQAIVRIPGPVTLEVDDEDPASVEVLMEGADFRAVRPRVEYVVSASNFPVHRITIPYDGHERRVAGGWRVDVNLVADQRAVATEYIRRIDAIGGRCPFLRLHRAEFSVIVGDPEWDPPEGVFEFDILVHPRTMSNVENGFGFIAGGYRFQDLLPLSRESIEYACFLYVD